MEAITGGKKQAHVIEQEKCTKCRRCFEVCPSCFDAVRRLSGEPVSLPVPQEARVMAEKGGER